MQCNWKNIIFFTKSSQGSKIIVAPPFVTKKCYNSSLLLQLGSWLPEDRV